MRQVESAICGEQIPLFDVGVDMAKLRAEFNSLRRASHAQNTVASYATGWKDFEKWCSKAGKQALPATGGTLALYVTYRLGRGLRINSVKAYMAGITATHKDRGQPVPSTADAWLVIHNTQRRRREQPRQRIAMSPENLRKISRHLEGLGTRQGLRDRAIILLGFAAGLRQSNLVALDLADLRFVPKKGVAITLRWSKTDQKGVGRVIGVRSGQREETDPVKALQEWLKVRGPSPGPLFVNCENDYPRIWRLKPAVVNRVVKDAVAGVGIDATNYGSHSLRAGCVTVAHANGAADLTIMERTGHKSLKMVQTYMRHTDPFAGPDPLAKAI